MLGIYLPKVGDIGFYSFDAPFQNIQTQRLECIRVSRLSDLASSIDVLLAVYTENGIGQDVYDSHVEKDLQIALMVKPDGNEIYIPVSYFKSYVQTTAVEYVTRVICLNLGAIPKELGTAHIVNEIRVIGEALVGKNELEVFAVEDPVQDLITEEEHESLERIRLAAVNASNNPYTEIDQLKAKIESLEETIRIYEQEYTQ